MKQTKFTLTEPEYRALRLKAEEAKRLRRAIRKLRRDAAESVAAYEGSFMWCVRIVETLDRALARRKR